MPILKDWAEFGSGDILIGLVEDKDGNALGLLLEQADRPHVIGERAEGPDCPLSECGEHIGLTFTDVKSVGVLIECLEELKLRMSSEGHS